MRSVEWDKVRKLFLRLGVQLKTEVIARSARLNDEVGQAATKQS